MGFGEREGEGEGWEFEVVMDGVVNGRKWGFFGNVYRLEKFNFHLS